MKIRKISFYDRFKCTGGLCGLNCCKGWRINVDDSARERFKHIPGIRGLALRLSMREREGMCVMNPESGRCPHLNRQGFCRLQLEYGHDFLPEICRRFPRIITTYGDLAELSLDLTCVRAGELFLTELDNMRLTELVDIDRIGLNDDELARTKLPPRNDDPGFLEDLFTTRAALVRLFEEATDWQALDLACCAALDLTDSAQLLLSKGGRLRDASFPDTVRSGRSLMPFSIMAYHRILTTDFYEDRLRVTTPLLHELCCVYFDRFSGLSEIAGQERLTGDIRAFTEACPDALKLIRGFLLYHIYTDFCTCYADYSLSRNICTGIVCANLLLLFLALDCSRGHTLSPGSPLPQKRTAEIISAILHRIRHNEAVRQQVITAMRFRPV